jgi:hypothetical protein
MTRDGHLGRQSEMAQDAPNDTRVFDERETTFAARAGQDIDPKTPPHQIQSQPIDLRACLNRRDRGPRTWGCAPRRPCRLLGIGLAQTRAPRRARP